MHVGRHQRQQQLPFQAVAQLVAVLAATVGSVPGTTIAGGGGRRARPLAPRLSTAQTLEWTPWWEGKVGVERGGKTSAQQEGMTAIVDCARQESGGGGGMESL